MNDPTYLGLKQRRQEHPATKEDELVAEFFEAIHDKFGKGVLIQFEDFGNKNAFRLLKQWQDKACTFNDDIQGTASVALAGLFASKRVTGKDLHEHTFLFNGAGEAGTGIADLIAYAIATETGKTMEEARSKIFLVDSKGLVTKARLEGLQHHKLSYAHEVDAPCPDLLSAVKHLKPSALVGVSAIGGSFTKEIVEFMAEINEQPIICALSNPTSKAECTAQQAYEWTNGKAIFSSGSPFDPVTLPDGRHFVPGQGKNVFAVCMENYAYCLERKLKGFVFSYSSGNNAYIFPGIGLGCGAAGASRITDHDMYIAAQTLAECVSEKDLEVGCMYPPLSNIREVSVKIAANVAENAHKTGVATKPKPKNMKNLCESLMYDPFADPYELVGM